MPKQRKEYKSLASDIIRLVGGRENIDKIIHCVTRLRFYLKYNTIADKDKLQDLDRVIEVVESGGNTK